MPFEAWLFWFIVLVLIVAAFTGWMLLARHAPIVMWAIIWFVRGLR